MDAAGLEIENLDLPRVLLLSAYWEEFDFPTSSSLARDEQEVELCLLIFFFGFDLVFASFPGLDEGIDRDEFNSPSSLSLLIFLTILLLLLIITSSIISISSCGSVSFCTLGLFSEDGEFESLKMSCLTETREADLSLGSLTFG